MPFNIYSFTIAYTPYAVSYSFRVFIYVHVFIFSTINMDGFQRSIAFQAGTRVIKMMMYGPRQPTHLPTVKVGGRKQN